MKSVTLVRSLNSISRWSQVRLLRFTSTGQAVKPYEDLPGPVSLPFIGTTWQFLPYIGQHDLLHLDHVGEAYYRKFGSIVREKFGKINVLHLFEPEDFETLAKATNENPLRMGFFGLARYRNSNPDKYNSPGILPINGDGWWKLRQVFQKPISPLRETRDFLGPTDDITKDFVDLLKSGETIDDFMFLANRLNMELVCELLFGERIHCFDGEAMSPNSFMTHLLTEVVRFAEGIGEHDRAEMGFKYQREKNYRMMERTLRLMEEFIEKMVEKMKARGNLSDDKCILAQFMANPDINEKELLAITVDLLLGGIHTTAITSSFLLYHMGTLPDVQAKLREEAKRLLPKPDSRITKEMLNEAVYTRAVVKEVLRVNPIATAQGRMLHDDVSIAGYRIPKDTLVICQTLVACRMERHFKDALKFKPERWIKGSPEYERTHPYLVVPFGLGLRSCIARRRAEQNLLVFSLRVFSQFEVKWMRGDTLTFTTPFMVSPEGPVKIMFTRN